MSYTYDTKFLKIQQLHVYCIHNIFITKSNVKIHKNIWLKYANSLCYCIIHFKLVEGCNDRLDRYWEKHVLVHWTYREWLCFLVVLCSIKWFVESIPNQKPMPISVLVGSSTKLELNTFICFNIHRKSFTVLILFFLAQDGSWFGKILFGLHLANILVKMEIIYCGHFNSLIP